MTGAARAHRIGATGAGATMRPVLGLLLLLWLGGCLQPTELPGTGSRCSPLEPCPEWLTCFRTVCIPEVGEPLPSSSPVPSSSPLPSPLPPPIVPRDAFFSATHLPVEVFAAGDFLLVVDAESVSRLDASGQVVGRFAPGRTITAAAFDGDYLAVADREVVTALSPTLVELSRTDVAEPCTSAVIMDGHRLVCGPENDWQRVYSTIDLVDGGIVAQSQPFTYKGMKLMRVPGRAEFVAFSNASSPSLHLFEVPGDVPVYVNRWPYHGDVPLSSVNAFSALPSTHVITASGRLLRIRGEGCGVPGTRWPLCFELDGDLGVLPIGATYVALTHHVGGHVFGLRSSDPSRTVEPVCSAEVGCILDRVDVAARRLVERAEYREHVDAIHSIVYQPEGRRLVVVALTAGPTLFERSGYSLRAIAMTTP